MSLTEHVHGTYVHRRRTRVLSAQLAQLIPPRFRLLDVGCGDGLVAHSIMQQRPDLDVQGLDVMVREQTHIPVKAFDGYVIPYDDASFDGVMFVDVLHHTHDPLVLLREALRVARQAVVIKDHALNGFCAGLTLRWMDKVGNARHGVVLPYNYWPKQRWFQTFETLGVTVGAWTTHLGLYPWPANWIFERSLHFCARLDCT